MLRTKETDPLRRAEHLKDLSDEGLREVIAALLLGHPNLTMSGFDVRGDGPERSLLSAQGVSQTRRCLSWLASGVVQTAAKIDPRRNSSTWKHLLERTNGYVSAGAFTAAALLAGLKWKRVKGTCNATFALAESPRPPERLNRFGVERRAA